MNDSAKVSKRRGGFKTQLLIGMAAIILAFAALMFMLLTRTGSSNLYEYYSMMTLDSVQKDMQLVDFYLFDVIRNVKQCNVDSEMYSFVSEAARGSRVNAYALTTRLQSRYFSEYDDIIAANFTASYYHSSSGSYSIPYNKFCATPLYADSLFGRPSESWMPTHTMAELAQVEISASGHAKTQLALQPAFSYARLMTCSTVSGNQLLTLPTDVERPYIVLSFSPTLYDRYFDSSLPTSDSFYFVTSDAGELITQSAGLPDGFVGSLLSDGRLTDGVYTIDVGGVQYLIGAAHSVINDWCGIIAIPSDDISTALATRMVRTILLLAAILALILIAVLLYSRSISRPIEHIATAVDAGSISTLNSTPRPGYPRELGVISDTLQALDAQVEAYSRENSELAQREQQATIRNLELQLNPHFLRNTLSQLQGQAIGAGQEKLASDINELAGILQYALDTHAHFVYLYQEFDELKRYVAIMQRRQRTSSIRLYIDAEPELYDCIIPKLLLQPLVENSILHGFAGEMRNALIRVRAVREGEDLIIYIEDNGRGIDLERANASLNEPPTGHVGCANTHQRLKLLYGDDYGISFMRTEYTVVRVRLPFVQAGED